MIIYNVYCKIFSLIIYRCLATIVQKTMTSIPLIQKQKLQYLVYHVLPHYFVQLFCYKVAKIGSKRILHNDF